MITTATDGRGLFAVDTTLWRGKRVPDPYINAYRLSFVTGLRPGELIALRWADIQGDMVMIHGAINVHGEKTRGKNSNALRSFALTSQAKEILEAQRELTGGEEFVFPIEAESTYRHCCPLLLPLYQVGIDAVSIHLTGMSDQRFHRAFRQSLGHRDESMP